jgi:hypothetical protein
VKLLLQPKTVIFQGVEHKVRPYLVPAANETIRAFMNEMSRSLDLPQLRAMRQKEKVALFFVSALRREREERDLKMVLGVLAGLGFERIDDATSDRYRKRHSIRLAPSLSAHAKGERVQFLVPPEPTRRPQ